MFYIWFTMIIESLLKYHINSPGVLNDSFSNTKYRILTRVFLLRLFFLKLELLCCKNFILTLTREEQNPQTWHHWLWVLMSWECLKLHGCACKDSKFCLLEKVAPLVVNKKSSVCLPYTGGNLCMLSCRGGRHQSWNFFYRTSYTYLCNQHYSCCSNFFHKSNSSITLHNTLLKAYLLLEL